MTKNRLKLLNAMIEKKQHYKMYKSGKFLAFACIVTAGFFWSAPGISANADSTTTAATTTSVSSASSSSAVTGSDASSINSGTDSESSSANKTTDDSDSASSSSSSTNVTGVSDKKQQIQTAGTDPDQMSQSAAENTDTKSPTGDTDSDSGSEQKDDGNQPTAAQEEVDRVDATSIGSDAPTSDSSITTADLNNANPSNFSAGSSDASKVDLTTIAEINNNFDAEQKIVQSSGSTDGTTKSIMSNFDSSTGALVLVDKTKFTIGTLVYENQIDMSKAFSFKAELSTNNGSGGGGLGYILQAVDPQEAGVGVSSAPSQDIGISGQADTIFIGRDAYQTTSTKDPLSSDGAYYADSNWDQLVIRETADNGALNSETPYWISTTKENLTDDYGELTWTPSTINADGTVTGILTYTTYSDADYSKETQSVSSTVANLPSNVSNNGLTSGTTYYTTASDGITVSRYESIAAFGAAGNDTSDIRTVAGESFSGSVVTDPVTINYVDINSGDEITSTTSDVTNLNVGDSLTVGATTDTSTNTFAAKEIAGYTFVKAVSADGTNADGVSATITAVNSTLNSSTQNGASNTITVYYTNQTNYTIQPIDAAGNDITGLTPVSGTGTMDSQVATPTYTGYTASGSKITLPALDNATIKVTYTANTENFEVSYQGLPADTTPVTQIMSGSFGTTYALTIPQIAGYTANVSELSGTYTEDEQNVVVTYTPSDNNFLINPIDKSGTRISSLSQISETGVTGSQLTIPTYAGYTVDSTAEQTVVAGQTSYDVVYSPNAETLTVHYVGLPEGQTLPDDVENGVTDEQYNYAAPVVTGYAPDQTNVSGVYGASNATITITYTKKDFDYYVLPIDSNGNVISGASEGFYNGEAGSPIQQPTVKGYSYADDSNSSLTVPNVDGVTLKAVYDATDKLTVYVHYEGAGDSTPADGTESGLIGTTYTIVSPTVAGYTPDKSSVTGVFSEDETDPLTTVTYLANTNVAYTVTPVDESGQAISGLSVTSEKDGTVGSAIDTPDYTTEGYEAVTSQTIPTLIPGQDNYDLEYETISPEKVTINYRAADGTTPLSGVSSYSTTLDAGKTISVVSPVVTGYELVDATESTVNVTYNSDVAKSENGFTLTVNYQLTPETVHFTYTGLDSSTLNANSTNLITSNTGEDGASFTLDFGVAGYTAKLPEGLTSTDGQTTQVDFSNTSYTIAYVADPTQVEIEYEYASNNNPANVVTEVGTTTKTYVDTVTGVFGGTYSINSPVLSGYTPNTAVVSGTFDTDNLTTNSTIQKIIVLYTANTSLIGYTMTPVDINGNAIQSLQAVTGHAKQGTEITPTDYSSSGYQLVDPSTIYTVQDASNDSKINDFQVEYKQIVSYIVQPIDVSGTAIAGLTAQKESGYVGDAITEPTYTGYELVSGQTTPIIESNTSTATVEYEPKPVTVVIVPVNASNQAISGLTSQSIDSYAGGTSISSVTLPTYDGYVAADGNTASVKVPITDTGEYDLHVIYKKIVTITLSGTETVNTTGSAQTPDLQNYHLTMSDGTSLTLSAGQLQLTDASGQVSDTVSAVGTYTVSLTNDAVTAIEASLNANYSVSLGTDNATYSIIDPNLKSTTYSVTISGLPETDDKTSVYTVNWKGSTDANSGTQVWNPISIEDSTGNTVWDTSNQGTTFVPITERIAGYELDTSGEQFSLAQSASPLNHAGTVTYRADESATIEYRDVDNNNTIVNIADPQIITGALGVPSTWTAIVPSDYKLASGQLQSDSYTFTSDDNQTIIVNVAHQHTTGLMYTTDSLNYSGLPEDDEVTKSTTITWTTDIDDVTGAETWTPDITSAVTLESPIVDGYTAQQTDATFGAPSKITATKDAASDPGPQNAEITVTYEADKQTLTLNYVDDDDNEKVLTDQTQTVSGSTGESEQVLFGSRVDATYRLAPDQADEENYTFTADDQDTITVHLVHKHKVVSAAKSGITTTRTITYVGAGSSTPQTVIQTVKWSTDTDEVTKQTIYTPDSDYSAVIVPSVNGYVANKSEVNDDLLSATNALPSNATPVKVSYVDEYVPTQAEDDSGLKGTEKQYLLKFETADHQIIKTMTYAGRTGDIIQLTPDLPDGYTFDTNQAHKITLDNNADQIIYVKPIKTIALSAASRKISSKVTKVSAAFKTVSKIKLIKNQSGKTVGEIITSRNAKTQIIPKKGEKFTKKQVKSIVKQSKKDGDIIISSSNDTVSDNKRSQTHRISDAQGTRNHVQLEAFDAVKQSSKMPTINLESANTTKKTADKLGKGKLTTDTPKVGQKTAKIPQTNERKETGLTLLGMVLGLIGLIGLRFRKRHEN